MHLDAEMIKNNFDLFRELCKLTGHGRAEDFIKIVDHFGERLAMCPASSRREYHLACPGGLVDHSLRVLDNATKLSETLEIPDVEKFDRQSLTVAALFHDFGKVGTVDEDLYLPETSQWHVEQGRMYVRNENIVHMTTSDRCLFILQHFGVRLTADEWLAIKLNDGQNVQENKPYSMKERSLSLIIHMADRFACSQEKFL